MTPAAEDKASYVQIGLGKKNPTNVLGEMQYDPAYTYYWPQTKDWDQSKSTGGKNPYDSSLYETRMKMRMNHEFPSSDWLHREFQDHQAFMIVMIATFILLIGGSIALCCKKKRTRANSYYVKTYSMAEREEFEDLDKESPFGI
mmetsp:Transcript_5724/g.9093  ORF Transcript_5724/g.9093 Transcript_5724/m.9093 type:complete len:144 (+) Transcript_5724:1130-1561(+)